VRDTKLVAAECQDWIAALNQGDYRYAVIGPDQRTQSLPPIEATWTADAGGTQVETSDDISVFKINGQLDPLACSAPNQKPQTSTQ
jgi:hypothetical protein